jgi:hypothetical protein
LRLVSDRLVLDVPCQRLDTTAKVRARRVVVSELVLAVGASADIDFGVGTAAADVLGLLEIVSWECLGSAKREPYFGIMYLLRLGDASGWQRRR